MTERLRALDRRLYERVSQLRWAVPAVVLALAALHQGLLSALTGAIDPSSGGLAALALYTSTGSVAVILGLSWIIRAVRQRAKAETELQQAAGDLARIQGHLELLQELGRQAANAADPQEVLGLAARVPASLLGARATAVVSLDPAHHRSTLEIAWGLAPEAVRALRTAVDSGWPAERCTACRPLSARVLENCPLLLPLVEAGCADGIQGVVCVPLGRAEQWQAVVASYIDATPHPERVRLFNILATELSAALESVQLRSRRLATLAAVDQAAAPRQNLEEFLAHALDTLVRGWGVQAGAILLREDDGEAWSLRAHQGLGADLTAPALGHVLSWAEQARAAAQSPLFPRRPTDAGLGSASVVLLIADGATMGALVLGSRQPGAFNPKQGPLMLALGHQLALSVRNIQLSACLREFAVVEERYRLSREMHDGLAQTLGALGLELDRATRLIGDGRIEAAQESLGFVRRGVTEAYSDVREAIDGLRVTADAHGGLAGALRISVADFAGRSGIVVDCDCPDDLPAVSPEVALQLLRIAQEALANVRRHAQARHVWVRLAADNGSLELSIADDGRGFDPGLSRGRHHLGLATMRERARAIGGQLTLATGPGRGTRTMIRVPVS